MSWHFGSGAVGRALDRWDCNPATKCLQTGQERAPKSRSARIRQASEKDPGEQQRRGKSADGVGGCKAGKSLLRLFVFTSRKRERPVLSFLVADRADAKTKNLRWRFRLVGQNESESQWGSSSILRH
jgi:hypothetical protein